MSGQGAKILGVSVVGLWWQILCPGAENGTGWVLDDFVTTEAENDVPVEIERREGSLAKETLKFAEEISADTILLGARGRPRLKDFIVGSRALQVLQGCSVPVLLVI